MNKYHLELKRANVIVGSGGEITNAVWGTITGDIKQQSDLQEELTAIKESIPEPYNDTEIKEDISNLESTKADKAELANLATKEELNSKQDTLVSGTTIKTINNQSLLGEGNITVEAGTSNWNDIQGKPEFATVATTGSYNDLSDKPEIPSDYIENITDSDTEFSIDTAFNYKSGKKYSLSFSKTGGFDVIIGGVGDTQRNINLSIDTDIIATKEDLADYQPVGDYATKTELASKQDTLVSGTNIKTINNQSLLGSGNIDITGGGTITVDSELSTTSENPVQNKVITNAINAKQDAGDYALKSEIPDISGLATKEELASKADSSALSNYATKTELDGKLDASTYNSDKAGFATKTEIADMLTKTEAASTYQTKGNYATKDEIPDISNLATKAELPTATSDLTNDSGYITSIPEEYITETELESKGYAVNSTVVSTYATKSEVNEQLGNINTILDTIIGQYSWAEF